MIHSGRKGGESMKNVDVRFLVSDKGIRYKDIAAVMGIRKDSLSRLMSRELSKRSRDRIMQAIQTIEDARNG